MKLSSFGLRADQFEYVQLIFLAAVVGVLSALGHFGFNLLIDFFSWVFRDLEWRMLQIPRGGFFLIFIPVVLVSGGVGMLILAWFFPGDVLGYGFPNFLEQVNLGNARIKRRWIFVKAMGAALSLGCGASVGREGPIAQIGGAIGSLVAQARRLATERLKVLVAASAGAAIAVTFNAPIGGLMFAQEIVLLGHAEVANLTLLIVATTSAVVTARAVHGNQPIFVVPPFVLRSYWEMLTYGLMGIGVGVLSAAYIRFFYGTAGFFRRLNVPEWARLALGLAAVGLIAIRLPQNLSDGYPVINQALAGQFEFGMLFALMVAKFIASSLSLGCGAPGGVFGPIFFIGTMAGGACQRAFASIIPNLTGPRGSYALVSLGAFLAGTTHAPLTGLFLLFEMTQNYTVAIPAMIATIAALAVARAIEPESIDTYRLAREGKTLHVDQERIALSQIHVGSVMTKDVTVVSGSAKLTDVLRLAGKTHQGILPVVDDEGELAGVIVTRELVGVLGSREELSPLVNAFDLCEREYPTVTPDSSLDLAAQTMEAEGVDELPVTERQHGGRFLGLVTRYDIGKALNRVTVSLSTLGTQDSNIFWATGYRITRVVVPPEAKGTTLRKLAPRARYGVSVLAVRDAEDPEAGFIPPAPDRALNAGDVLVTAGRSADLRRFSRALVQGEATQSSST